MKLAIITSNTEQIGKNAKKGTEIFSSILINALADYEEKENFEITVFASGDSRLPFRTESVNDVASSGDKSIPEAKRVIFELALLSKAFSMQEEFDLYHVNIGDGDVALPFAPFIKKPVLITLHNTANADYIKKYLFLFKKFKNLHYISVSDAQRKFFPDLNYAATIYHGVDINKFTFDYLGGDLIMWAGRAIPEKGIDIAIAIAKSLKKEANLFALKGKHNLWFQEQKKELREKRRSANINILENMDRSIVSKSYQKSKLFLFPILWEEPFGLVTIEAMSCGTPIVVFARGSMPEIIRDGETGYLVNPSDNDIRGNWIIKKTGIDGLKEAVKRIYAMPNAEYKQMRESCRKHVEQNFTNKIMAKNYIKIYKKVIKTGSIGQ